ncbi:MAG: ATP-binding protein [Candidatus Omnitrophica bacterium]|nr:ATP-binding protein [Candidatus Omnitrophota bacterium]
MTLLAFTALVNFITSILLGVFVFFQNPKGPQNRYYLFGNLSIGLYSFGYLFWQLSTDTASAYFWFKILTVGIILINISFLYFAFSFLGILEEKKRILRLCFLLNLIFIVLNLSSFLYVRLEPRFNLGYWPTPSIFFNFYLIFWFWQLFYGYYWLLNGLKKSSGPKRERVKYFTLAVVIGFLGGATNWPMWYSINFPPYLNILISVYVAIVTYAIFRHQLMDIEVIIKKSLVFAGMFAFALGVFVAVTLLVSQLFAGNTIISLAISSLIIVIGIRPLEAWLVNSTDKFLFQKKYEYKQIIRSFIDSVITELNLDEIISSTLKLLDSTLHPYAAGVFILNKVEDKYQLYNSFGLEDKNTALTSESKLISFLKKSHAPAVIRQIDGISGASPDIQAELTKLKAVIALPLMLHEDLIGFIALGKKRSDEEYTKDDLEILLDLSRTESIAVGNAQLLAEAAQAERRAAIGTMAAGINHEIGNPLNTINTKIQLFLVSVQRGLYRDKPKEEVVAECENILNETIIQTNRIADITRRLSNFAKPSKEFKPEAITVAKEIKEAIFMASHEIELDRIKINMEFPSEEIKIQADRHEIQQIFFNLIRNGAQAIEGNGVVTIRVLSSNNGKAHIEIEDTGKGIPQDKIHRIFEPFFTTKGTQGTGLGLSIVRQLVWRNKGEISFRSQEGLGTTFILEFSKV